MTISNFCSSGKLGFVVLMILFIVGCQSEVSAAAGSGAADVSGPAVYSAFRGARQPRVCERVTSPPDAAQAAALIQCHMDHATRENLFLMQNVKVQMSGTHPVGAMDGIEDNIDNSSKVYDLHGSHDYYNCAPINESVMHNTRKNCFVTHAASTNGECWKVHDGSFRCELQILAGPDGRAHTVAKQPGPTTY